MSEWFIPEVNRSCNWTFDWTPKLHLDSWACSVRMHSWNFVSGPRTKEWNVARSLGRKFTGSTCLINKTFSSSNGTGAGDRGSVKFFLIDYRLRPPAVWRSTIWISFMSLWVLHHSSNPSVLESSTARRQLYYLDSELVYGIRSFMVTSGYELLVSTKIDFDSRYANKVNRKTTT